MRKIIYVSPSAVKQNAEDGALIPVLVIEYPESVEKGARLIKRANEIVIDGPCRIHYDPDALEKGYFSRVWIETEADIEWPT